MTTMPPSALAASERARQGRYTEQLATFCAGLRYDDLPEDVVRLARLSILDSIGVMLSGATTAIGADAHRVATRFEPAGVATSIGFAGQTSPTAAALVNGTLLEVFELQDGWRMGNNHPCVVIAAALAIAEWKGSSGREVIAAVVAGYEVVNRLAWTLVPRHIARGFLPTGTAGTCGSAVTSASLLGMGAEATAQALGVAAFTLPVSTAENLWCGYSVKPLHAGYAARNGIEAALLAQEGFTGCPIEGSPQHGRGFLEITTGEVDFDRMVERLGDYYTLRDVYYKAIPACRHVHGTAEATINAVRGHGVRADDVEAIAVHTYTLSASRLNRYTDAGSSMITSQFSIPYVAAASLVDGAMGMAQFADTRIHDPALLALAQKVRVEIDPAIDAVYPGVTPTRVEVTLKDGRKLVNQVDMPKGDPRAPLTEAELIAKFRELAGMVLDERSARAVESAVLGLESLDTLAPLMRLLRKPGSAPAGLRIVSGVQRGRAVSFAFDGGVVAAHEGESVAAALWAAGVRHAQAAPSASAGSAEPVQAFGPPYRVMFCAMGICQQCTVWIDGTRMEACRAPVREGMDVRSRESTSHGV